MVTLEEADANPNEHLGRDFKLDDSFDTVINSSDDFRRITFSDNLKQSIIIRLKTAKGELALHPDYGSDLHQLLGTIPNVDTLALARLHVKDSLLQEPRIDSITKITPTFTNTLKDQIDIEIEVQPIKDLAVLNMVYSLFI